MSDAVCVRCGRELTQVQRWNRKKYCSRDCFYDTRFDMQEIANEESVKNTVIQTYPRTKRLSNPYISMAFDHVF